MKNEIFDKIKNAHYVLVLTHINPDADTISSALALSNYMFANKIKHKVYNSSKVIPRVLDFLPRFNKITNILPKFYDLVIYVDCGDEKRVNEILIDGVETISIDHHQSNTMFADINIVDETKASTAELLYELFEINNINITKEIATALYVGIYDDTNAFTTPRTDARTFEIINILIKNGANSANIAQNLLQRDSLARYRIMPKILETLELHNDGMVASVY